MRLFASFFARKLSDKRLSWRLIKFQAPDPTSGVGLQIFDQWENVHIRTFSHLESDCTLRQHQQHVSQVWTEGSLGSAEAWMEKGNICFFQNLKKSLSLSTEPCFHWFSLYYSDISPCFQTARLKYLKSTHADVCWAALRWHEMRRGACLYLVMHFSKAPQKTIYLLSSVCVTFSIELVVMRFQ